MNQNKCKLRLEVNSFMYTMLTLLYVLYYNNSLIYIYIYIYIYI